MKMDWQKNKNASEEWEVGDGDHQSMLIPDMALVLAILVMEDTTVALVLVVEEFLEDGELDPGMGDMDQEGLCNIEHQEETTRVVTTVEVQDTLPQEHNLDQYRTHNPLIVHSHLTDILDQHTGMLSHLMAMLSHLMGMLSHRMGMLIVNQFMVILSPHMVTRIDMGMLNQVIHITKGDTLLEVEELMEVIPEIMKVVRVV